MNTKRILYLLLALAGLLLILAGIFLFPEEAQKRIAGACYGLGSASLGLGLAWFASTFFPAPSAEALRRKAIDVADERNIQLREKTVAQVDRVTTYALIAWILLEGIFGDLTHTLLLIGLMAARFVLMIVFTNRYAKTM
jgi:hypothetical protein